MSNYKMNYELHDEKKFGKKHVKAERNENSRVLNEKRTHKKLNENFKLIKYVRICIKRTKKK